MKQLTVLGGFELSLGRGPVRRRSQKALRPTGALMPLDLDLTEIMEELDPGMIEWDIGRSLQWTSSQLATD